MAGERFLRVPWDSIDFALFSARFLLSMTRTQGRSNLNRIIEDDGNRILDSIAISNPTTGTYCYACWVPNETFIFIGGLTQRSEAEALWNGYLGPRTILPHSPYPNPYIQEQYQLLYNDIVSRFLTSEKITVAGHSFGGALAPKFRFGVNAPQTNAENNKAISFGAPCTYTSTTSPGFLSRDLIRYMNSDDPVPLVPFMDSVAFGASWFYGAHQLTNLRSFRHVGRGLNLGLDNTLFDADLPVAAEASRTASITSWLQQAGQGLINAHSLDTYVARLAAVRAANPRLPVPTPPPHITEPRPIGHGNIAGMVRDDVQTIVNDSHRRNNQPVVIPRVQLFEARRNGRVWNVSFGGTIISTSMNKKRARGLAREGNDFLRRLQRQEVVSVDDMAAQFLQYLSVASTPGSGITPTLNPGLPA